MNAHLDHVPQSKDSRKNVASHDSAVSAPSQVLVHPRLEMTDPGDSDEMEADEVADSIVSEGRIARSVSGSHSGTGISLPSHFGSRISSFQGQGSVISGNLKTQMESGFGHDFSSVRLHTDDAAAEMSSSISAQAFTYGNDIFFNRGQFNPDTKEGQHLIAHELTHVVQGSGKVERKKAPDYLSSDEAMIAHLVDTATSTDGYIERMGEETIIDRAFDTDVQFEGSQEMIGSLKEKWAERDRLKNDKKAKREDVKNNAKEISDLIQQLNTESDWGNIWKFIMERNFVLSDGLSNSFLKERLKNEPTMDPVSQEHAFTVLRKVFIRVQSGDTIKDALTKEEKDIKEWNLEGILTEGFVRGIQAKGSRNRDLDFLRNELKAKQERIAHLNKNNRKKESAPLKPKASALEKVIAEMGTNTSFEEALSKVRESMANDGIGEIELNEIVGFVSDVVRNGRKKENDASLMAALTKERSFLMAQGFDAKEAGDATDLKIDELVKDSNLLEIIFDDPENLKYVDLEGKQNNTMFHQQLGKDMGPSAQWCDHFVHWCFLKAFYPVTDEGWKKEGEKDALRNDILKYAMGEKGYMQGNVRGSIDAFGQNAFIDSKFNIEEIDKKYGITFRDNMLPGFEPGPIVIDGKTTVGKFKSNDIRGWIAEIKALNLSKDMEDRSIIDLKTQYLKAFKPDFLATQKTNLTSINEADKKEYEAQKKKNKKEVDGLRKKTDLTEEQSRMITEYDAAESAYNKSSKDLEEYKKIAENGEMWVEYASRFVKMGLNNQRVDGVVQSDPHPGDVFFKVGHTGLVIGIKDKNTIETMEGNTDGAGSSSGNAAIKKERPRSSVMGYGRPDYDGLRARLAKYYGVKLNNKPKSTSTSTPQTPQSQGQSQSQGQVAPMPLPYLDPNRKYAYSAYLTLPVLVSMVANPFGDFGKVK